MALTDNPRYVITVRGYVVHDRPGLIGGEFLNNFYSGSQFLAWLQVQFQAGSGAVLVHQIEFHDIKTVHDKPFGEPAPQQEVKAVLERAEQLSAAMCEAEAKGADFDLIDKEWQELTVALDNYRSGEGR